MPAHDNVTPPDGSGQGGVDRSRHGLLNGIVRTFLNSNLSLILILLAVALGLAALLVTPREEDPQIVVPLADIHVQFPGHSAKEVEQLVATPLEKILYHIDGVEYAYSMSMTDRAVITVRFFVGEDREDSLVKLFKKIDENVDLVPPGVTGWVVKPVEIDDVPIVTLTLTGGTADPHMLRRVGEEMVERLSAIEDISRAYVIGGEPRRVQVYLDPDRMQGYNVDPLRVGRALEAANVTRSVGDYTRHDTYYEVEAGIAFKSAAELRELVISTFLGRPVFLKDVAEIVDGPAEVDSYVRHGRGPAFGGAEEPHDTGMLIGGGDVGNDDDQSHPAVTIAMAKKRGANAVDVSKRILVEAERLKREVVPDNMELVITRNAGLTSDAKVNELVEALGVAIVFVIAVLTIGLGLRESLIVALAVPVVFGLTLTVNLVAGFTINRVTLFALILSLGLLVDDPIVDVENIARHFKLRGRATRAIVVEAVAEIRPPLITATLAVIVSFLPMAFITGMMGPYMRPMALNVPVAMIMSMLVAFTITPWLAYHVLKKDYRGKDAKPEAEDEVHDLKAIRRSLMYRMFYPIMAPLLRSRGMAWGFLLLIAVLTLGAAGLAATRSVPLKMLPFDNKNELQLVLDLDKGTTLERSDALVRELEDYLRTVPEVTDFTSYVGMASPMDFNGLVRHYYLRKGENVADIRVNLVGKKRRELQSHALGLRMRDDLTRIAEKHDAVLSIVETPPGPPVIKSVVAEIYGQPDHTYDDLLAAGETVRRRVEAEPFVVDVDDSIEETYERLTYITDKEKAALHGISVRDIVETLEIAVGGKRVGIVNEPRERSPLLIELRLPRPVRSRTVDLSRINLVGAGGELVPLAELGRWESRPADQTIYHKNLQQVVYVFAECAGRPPANVVVDIEADRRETGARPADARTIGSGWMADNEARPLDERTFFTSGSDIAWAVPEGIRIDFAGEGEWDITLRVFRDLGLAFAAALVGIYILLVGQTRSFVIPVVVMMAIPLTMLGIMPGFWFLNAVWGGQIGVYSDPIFFTATGMIGMIALAGIVTRDSIILVDFIHLSLQRGRSLFDAIMESRVVRLRPILLTSLTAMLSALPIAIDPIFSGLAWSLIFGIGASTVFTLFVIPVTYWLVYANRPGHGLPRIQEA